MKEKKRKEKKRKKRRKKKKKKKKKKKEKKNKKKKKKEKKSFVTKVSCFEQMNNNTNRIKNTTRINIYPKTHSTTIVFPVLHLPSSSLSNTTVCGNPFNNVCVDSQDLPSLLTNNPS